MKTPSLQHVPNEDVSSMDNHFGELGYTPPGHKNMSNPPLILMPRALAFMVLFLIGCQTTPAANHSELIHTVNGAISIKEIKVALTHEHVMSNFGKDIGATSHYDEAALMSQVVPYLQQVKSSGVDTLFDYTTAYFGRRVDLLQKIATTTGLNIVTNTGFYGAANDRYIPALAYIATEEEIAQLWITEFKSGIDGTTIKPGFIKLGFDSGVPSDIDQKLFIAGLITHLRTGLTLAVHTGDNAEAAVRQLQLLDRYNVRADAWIWAHANLMKDQKPLIAAATRGAWISLDGVKADNISQYLTMLKEFKANNLLHKVLLSHDGNGFPQGGPIRPFTALQQHLIPAMQSNGFTPMEIKQLLVENPQAAFRIEVKTKCIESPGEHRKNCAGQLRDK